MLAAIFNSLQSFLPCSTDISAKLTKHFYKYRYMHPISARNQISKEVNVYSIPTSRPQIGAFGIWADNCTIRFSDVTELGDCILRRKHNTDIVWLDMWLIWQAYDSVWGVGEAFIDNTVRYIHTPCEVVCEAYMTIRWGISIHCIR